MLKAAVGIQNDLAAARGMIQSLCSISNNSNTSKSVSRHQHTTTSVGKAQVQQEPDLLDAGRCGTQGLFQDVQTPSTGASLLRGGAPQRGTGAPRHRRRTPVGGAGERSERRGGGVGERSEPSAGGLAQPPKAATVRVSFKKGLNYLTFLDNYIIRKYVIVSKLVGGQAMAK